MCKILPRGVRTISTPGKSNSENVMFRVVLTISISNFKSMLSTMRAKYKSVK